MLEVLLAAEGAEGAARTADRAEEQAGGARRARRREAKKRALPRGAMGGVRKLDHVRRAAALFADREPRIVSRAEVAFVQREPDRLRAAADIHGADLEDVHDRSNLPILDCSSAALQSRTRKRGSSKREVRARTVAGKFEQATSKCARAEATEARV